MEWKWNGIAAKYELFRGYLFDALVRGKPIHPGAPSFVTNKLESLGQHSEYFMILVCAVLIQPQSVMMDRQTDRRRLDNG